MTILSSYCSLSLTLSVAVMTDIPDLNHLAFCKKQIYLFVGDRCNQQCELAWQSLACLFHIHQILLKKKPQTKAIICDVSSVSPQVSEMVSASSIAMSWQIMMTSDISVINRGKRFAGSESRDREHITHPRSLTSHSLLSLVVSSHSHHSPSISLGNIRLSSNQSSFLCLSEQASLCAL